MSFTYIHRAAIALALFAVAGCTVKSTQEPPLAGPSGLALSLQVNAVPDSINQDGASQSSVKVTAIGPDGKPVSGLPLRMDMSVNGVAADFGTLSARSIVTNPAGVATVVYTAPPAPPNGIFTPCASNSSSLPGSCVSIVATATATNFSTATPESVLIRLVPTGVILPPAETLTPSFVVSPAAPAANSPVQFDGSLSCGGLLVSGICPANAPNIVSYSWSFGDGQVGTGKTVSHSFALQQPYTVTLTITNALGASASTSTVVSVGGGSLPKADFTVSPADPVVSQLVFFNALTSTAGAGHTIASYSWSFGDGATGSGATASHAFAASGTYSVQLTVADESGQTNTSSAQSVKVGTGNPLPSFTLSPAAPTGGVDVLFDASGTQVFGGATIQSYQWAFPNGSPSSSTNGPQATTRFAPAGSAYVVNVTLTIVDSLGRRGTISIPVTVSP